jgi:hypothetical protein
MDLLEFHERIYGKYKCQLFVFEPTWDSFRPIERIAWNGDRLVPIDDKYKPDLFDKNYGYGSLEMKALCRKLSQETELSEAKEVKDPIHLWRWYGETNVKWWRDRPVVFATPCISKDPIAWKHYLKYLDTRAKTLRRPFGGKSLTRKVNYTFK